MDPAEDIGVGEIPSSPPAEKRTRRSSTDLRKENVSKGALLLRIIWEGVNWVMPGVVSVPEAEKNHKFNNVDGKNPKKREEPYRTCERKGFRVVKGTGCFAPHSQYCTKGKGASEKAYQLLFFAINGFVPKQHGKGESTTDPETGKDITWQLSHLCHCRWCCRVDHVIIEQGWRNKMRNFCLGPIRKYRLPNGSTIDTCGCSLQFHVMGKSEMAGPPCIAAYKVSPEAPPDDLVVCSSFGELGHVLRETKFPLKVAFVTYTKREAISKLRALSKSNVAADKKKLKDDMTLLSPASKKLMKHGGSIAFDTHGSFDLNKTIVVLPDSDEESDEPAKKKKKTTK